MQHACPQTPPQHHNILMDVKESACPVYQTHHQTPSSGPCGCSPLTCNMLVLRLRHNILMDVKKCACQERQTHHPTPSWGPCGCFPLTADDWRRRTRPPQSPQQRSGRHGRAARRGPEVGTPARDGDGRW